MRSIVAPAADFDRMVCVGRLMGALFISDDYLDNGKMFDRLSGFKKVATGEGVRSGDRCI